MPPAAASCHDDLMDDQNHHRNLRAECDLLDDDDEAGYQAMLSDLPAIVTISGLLDGDFDELNEISNLLAPVSDDDGPHNTSTLNFDVSSHTQPDEEAAEELAMDRPTKTSTQSPSYYQVPNPIPNCVPNPVPNWTPSAATSSLSKRRRQEKNAIAASKKKKLDSSVKSKTPAIVPTSANGIPNPLLFGRPIDLPAATAASNGGQLSSSGNNAIVSGEEKNKDDVTTNMQPTSLSSVKVVKQATNNARKIVHLSVPKLTIPVLPQPSLHQKVPLCKMAFKGKVEATIASMDSAIAKVGAPRQKRVETQNGTTSNTQQIMPANACKGKKENQQRLVISEKGIKTKKSSVKAGVTKKVGVNGTKNEGEGSKKMDMPKRQNEKFLVANPLANVPKSFPLKPVVPPMKVDNDTSKDDTAAAKKENPVPTSVASAEKPPGVPSQADAFAKCLSTNSSKLKPTTAAERAKACRDRNREHARNTRLRKKAYLEELKLKLISLAEERDELLAQHQKADQLKQTRKRNMQQFLRIRGGHQHTNHEESVEDLKGLVHNDKTFTLTLPDMAGYYRGSATIRDHSNDEKLGSATEQVLTGVQEVIADESSFSSFLQSLGTDNEGCDISEEDCKVPVHMDYKFDESQFFLMDGSTAILNWNATTCGAVSQGAKSEISISGTFRAHFSPDTNKLVSGVLMFDTGSLRRQLSSRNRQ